MKYNINDEVVVKYNSQIVRGKIINAKKILFGNRYTLLFNVNVYDEGQYKYTKTSYKGYWEKNILGERSTIKI